MPGVSCEKNAASFELEVTSTGNSRVVVTGIRRLTESGVVSSSTTQEMQSYIDAVIPALDGAKFEFRDNSLVFSKTEQAVVFHEGSHEQARAFHFFADLLATPFNLRPGVFRGCIARQLLVFATADSTSSEQARVLEAANSLGHLKEAAEGNW